MGHFNAIFKREFNTYMNSPISFVFIVIFLMATVGCSFFLGGFFERQEASLDVFFIWHPWLFLFLIPAIGMRLWSEEKKSGTIEILFTLPITVVESVAAKFIAAWAFLGVALLLTFPMVLTVLYLGEPDMGVVITGYIGSFLMGGAYLAVSSFTSALTKNQVISFILSVIFCFTMLLLGVGVFSNILNNLFPQSIAEFIVNLGFLAHFEGLKRGLIDSRDIIYFMSIILVMLGANITVLEIKRS